MNNPIPHHTQPDESVSRTINLVFLWPHHFPLQQTEFLRLKQEGWLSKALAMLRGKRTELTANEQEVLARLETQSFA
jgi:hypothetical protein